MWSKNIIIYELWISLDARSQGQKYGCNDPEQSSTTVIFKRFGTETPFYFRFYLVEPIWIKMK